MNLGQHWFVTLDLFDDDFIVSDEVLPGTEIQDGSSSSGGGGGGSSSGVVKVVVAEVVVAVFAIVFVLYIHDI